MDNLYEIKLKTWLIVAKTIHRQVAEYATCIVWKKVFEPTARRIERQTHDHIHTQMRNYYK